MSPESRIYLDFDGVVNALNPDKLHGLYADTMKVGDAVIPRTWAQIIEDLPGRGTEIIWATHREDDVYTYTDQLYLPRHPHLVFTDPTGSKVKDIIAHYQANPCDEAVVYEDSLTSAEVEALNAAGLDVEIYQNTQPMSFHHVNQENKQ